MSISDGLGPFIFCRKTEKARPMRKEMDGNDVYFPPESALPPLMLYFSTVLFPTCTLTWQLANNYVFANFHNNINRISKLPKSPTTTMPTFHVKSEKFELFEDLFQMSLKIHNQLIENDRFSYFHSLMRVDALKTSKNINGPTRENLEEILAVFRRKYVKPQLMATAKHKF